MFWLNTTLGDWKTVCLLIMCFSLFFCLLFVTPFYSFQIQSLLVVYFQNESAVESLRFLFLSVGSALFGSAALVTSLVMFALQVNISRMPFSLFGRFSKDRKLLIALALVFTGGVFIASLSVFTVLENLAVVIYLSLCTVSTVLILVVYSYRRVLALINPIQQLKILADDVRKDLKLWSRRARRMSRWFDQLSINDVRRKSPEHNRSLSMVAFFKQYHYWADRTQQAIKYAILFSRYYAEQRDYEITAEAMRVVEQINLEYIRAKGRTFFVNSTIEINPLAEDVTIIETLEHLRQVKEIGISVRDETLTRLSLATMSNLVSVYLTINYISDNADKMHADRAARYLATAVESLIPHDLPDVVTSGLRNMGQSSQQFLVQENPFDVLTFNYLCEKVATIACRISTEKRQRLSIAASIEQLAGMTYGLLLSTGNFDVFIAAEKLQKNVEIVTTSVVIVPVEPPGIMHSHLLQSYYSWTSDQSLLNRLVRLVNILSDRCDVIADSRRVIHNIERWADGMHLSNKDILLVAINTRSNFTHDMIRWITGLTQLFIDVSNTQDCDKENKKKFQDHACRMIRNFTWIPCDKESVFFVEVFEFTEKLFNAAINAHRSGCEDVVNTVESVLTSWSFNGGKHRNEQGVFHKGLYFGSLIAVLRGDEYASKYINSIKTELSSESAPSLDFRITTAQKVEVAANRPPTVVYPGSTIESALTEINQCNLRNVLNEVSSALSNTTETAN